MTLALRYTVRSDVGLLREGNEDSAYAGPHLLAIADGMGGHAAGEVASAVAIATLAPLDADTSGMDMLQALADAIAEANAELKQITMTDPSTEGMGTTLTALLWSGEEVALCHIGDSRGYLLRDGEYHRITHDHTLVQSLVDEGRLTPEAAASHPQRSLVMRALQSSVPAEPDLAMLKAKVGDRYLLCSDGLSDVVSDDTVHKTLMELTDLDAAVGQLIDLAIRSGGPDNITCVLADVIDADAGQCPEHGRHRRRRADRRRRPARRAGTQRQPGRPGSSARHRPEQPTAPRPGPPADAGPPRRHADNGSGPGTDGRWPRPSLPGRCATTTTDDDEALLARRAAALARGIADPARAARRRLRRRRLRLAADSGRVLRRHRQRPGGGLPRREPGRRRDQPVQHGAADQHPDHVRAERGGGPDPGDDSRP